MKKYFFLFLFFIACNNGSIQNNNATNALDAGREFIDACMKGDFARANVYMLQDEKNKEYLLKIERDYREKGRDGRQQYREASINIAQIENITETSTIINYSNSYDKVAHKIKVQLLNNKWLVDFKYTFNPNL